MPVPSPRATRRDLARWLGAGAALSLLRSLPAVAASTPARSAAERRRRPVRLSANENPYGPPESALVTARAALAEAHRYPDERDASLRAALAHLHATTPDAVLLGCGSSQVLHAAAAAFAPPGAACVAASPTFEALPRFAAAGGARVRSVPLTADHAHDLPAMRAALGEAGLVYVCNPNNPTASLTPAGDLRGFLEALPGRATAIVDEAYHHYADGDAGYASMAAVALARPNVVVVRTFSKIYGMAGLRCGYALAQPDTLARIRERLAWDASNVVGLAAAESALGDAAYLAQARATNAEVRASTLDALARAGVRVVPSHANFFMADLGADVGPVIEQLRGQEIEVGRRFSAMPNHLRVTVGTAEEMAAFLDAFGHLRRG